MKARYQALGLCLIAGVSVGVAWVGGRFGGTPVLPLANPNGTSCTFAADPAEVVSAVSNAFNFFKYHDMMLTDPAGGNWRSSNRQDTNVFLLVPTTSVLGTVKTKSLLGRRVLPYVATFRITLASKGTNGTVVNVKTITSRVLDGLAFGHGGIVANTVDVAPVKIEEENIVRAIEGQLQKK